MFLIIEQGTRGLNSHDHMPRASYLGRVTDAFRTERPLALCDRCGCFDLGVYIGTFFEKFGAIFEISATMMHGKCGAVREATALHPGGGILVREIDNVLRPMFVGNRLRLRTIPAFISRRRLGDAPRF